MAWDQLSINKPHLVYIILGGFTSIFMLVSLFIKEKLYIGEATVATICGLIFGPHAANLIDPATWGNTDQITLEFSRIVLVVQCFAVGVELPKAYMERHWRSVLCLLVPVMTFGWLITSLFIWWLIEPLSWLESLCCAACVTATDPVLASSVVGKGKFAKRVPKHIRDLLSAESGCNDGMAFPFIYLALNLIHYHLDAKHVTQHWFVNTILYECIWGAVYGVLIGYLARHAIKWAERKGIIDRESFLVFYFVLALFCAGSGSMLGMDDLLIGFAAGVGFSNDGWFTEKTEESHVSNVIDLLLNLTYFVYLGTIIPWDQFNASEYGLDAWRLVCIALLVIFFRRIPIMLALKPIIPDIKTWREALFCGHFGPIGVGAIFVAILARAELESGSTTPLAQLPDPSDAEYTLIYTIWPITTFLVIASIVVHGSSIAVFTLGKRINTLTMTLSYTKDNDYSSNWMDRLPRIASRSRSQGKSFDSEFSEDEKEYPPGTLPTHHLPPLQLRRQKETDDAPYRPSRRSRSKKRRNKKMYGGPISDSAIAPQRAATDPALTPHESGSDTLNEKSEGQSVNARAADQSEKHSPTDSDEDSASRHGRQKDTEHIDEDVEVEAYEERHHLIVEDEEGNVLETVNTEGRSPEEKRAIIEQAKARLKKDSDGKYAHRKHEPHAEDEEEEITDAVKDAVEHPQKNFFKAWKGFGRHGESSKKEGERKRGPAHAYQIGRTIIVEDEDGEVIHKYDIPREEGEQNKYNDFVRGRLQRMGTLVGLSSKDTQKPEPLPAQETSKVIDEIQDSSSTSPDKERTPSDPKDKPKPPNRTNTATLEDQGLRMVISNTESYGLTGLKKPKPGERPPAVGGGRRMSTQDFLQHVSKLDRTEQDKVPIGERKSSGIIGRGDNAPRPGTKRAGTMPLGEPTAVVKERGSEAGDYFSNHETDTKTTGNRRRAQSDVGRCRPGEMGATQPASQPEDDSDDEAADQVSDVPTFNLRDSIRRRGQNSGAEARRRQYSSAVTPDAERIEEESESDDEGETAAEKKRRLAALGKGDSGARDSDSEEEGPRVARGAVPEPDGQTAAETPRQRIQWGGETRGQVYGQEATTEAEQVGQASSSGGFGRFKKFLNK